ncbi:MAG: hypothetical protein LWX56_11365 [Ignavibacteria bacterium]|nr:hypothetical protein [Ignavibacteria bacterium]
MSLTLFSFDFSSPIAVYSLCFVLSSVVYIFAAWKLRKTILPVNFLYAFLAAGFLLRIAFLFAQPTGSDDFHRYIWDGSITAHGVNPYRYAPSAPELQQYATESIPSKVNFPGMKSIYFPIAQLFFVLAYYIGGYSVWGLKILFLLCEAFTVFFLWRTLNLLEKPKVNLLLYLLSPLAVSQIIVDLHIDGFGIMLLAGFMYFSLSKKFIPATIFLALSILVKPAAVIIVPLYLQVSEKAIRLKIIGILALIVTALFIPFFQSANPLAALLMFSKNWTFNGFVFNLTFMGIANNQAARLICGALFVITYSAIFFSSLSFLKKLYFVQILLLLLSPVVHQWYVLWLLVLLPVIPMSSGVVFAGLISLSIGTVYSYQVWGKWQEFTLLFFLEYLPVVVLLIYELYTEKALFFNAPFVQKISRIVYEKSRRLR